ncbi:hypothetical protein EG329_012631 [Mollisiaceae sp. DMI_Dod_QoI]|nr:hypothetical protein EG329_012631 [Helotiales sp. DMI_Dod_QoI]
MDSPWRYGQYSPSAACEIAPQGALDADRFTAESSEVISYTQILASLPYDPETWLNRSNCLRLLGYPELALGDAYKARLLVEAGLEPLDMPSVLGNEVRKAFRKKTYEQHTTDPAWMKWADAVSTPGLLDQKVNEMLKRLELQIWTELMEGLMAANCCGDYKRMSAEAVERFPDDAFFPSEVLNAEAWYAQRETLLNTAVEKGEMGEIQMKTTLLNGGVYPTAYPFMTADLLVRDQDVFASIEEDFRRVSSNCMVVRSTIRNTPGEGGKGATVEDDCIGVIATRDIIAGETVLIDAMSSGSVGVDADPGGCPTCCAGPVKNFWNSCCSVLYCSQNCADVAIKTFHGSICGKDFEYLYTAARKATETTDFSLDALLLMRVLALTLEEDAEHPLKSTVLVRLTPAYGFKEPNLIIFNFEDHIQVPISILQTLGIDIFTNPSYDTWVLHTIKCRLQNNKHGQTLGDWPGTSISGLYKVTMFATRDCKKGEDLCISYIGAQGNGMALTNRRKKLMGWFGMAYRQRYVWLSIALDYGFQPAFHK